MNYQVAIIGPKHTISGFAALGVVPKYAETSEEAMRHIQELRKTIFEDSTESQKYAVIMVLENLLNGIPFDEQKKLLHDSLPVVVGIPGVLRDSEGSLDRLKKLSEQAVGVSLLP
jgi:vacuolar-type H+-ATPase subunit F/Vma7